METDNGWIKIKCDIRQHWLWQDSEKLFWWLDMLLMAEKEDRKVLYDSNLITIERGCILAGVSTLCERWGKSNKTIVAFLHNLEHFKMIEREVKGRSASIIKVCNFDDFYIPYERQLQTLRAEEVHTLISTLNSCGSDILRCVDRNELQTLVQTLVHTLKEEKDEKETKKEKEKVPHTPHKEKEINKEKEEKEEKSSIRLSNDNLSPTKKIVGASESNFEVENVENLEAEIVTDRFPWNKLKTMWNTICVSYPKLISISETRKNKVRVRVKEMGGQDEALMMFEILFHKMEESNFMKGDSTKGWKASFDWLITNPNNWVKVYEGNYDNDKQKFNYGNNTQQTTYEQRAATVARIVEEGIAASREELRNRGRVPDPVLPF